MMDGWFEGLPVLKTLGNSLIEANINKYDNILDMFADEHGEIDVERIISDLPTDKPIEMDLRQLSPILPNRVLLITKEDLDIFLKMIS
ncbi:MAG: hypothetical protein UD103_06940 [Bacteroidales bacterium]|nr:hypothetical protein [Bacteroidales bacterium]